MMSKLKSNKGSSFIYVLVVLLILTILTASLITATVTNYQLGILKGGRNTSFYMNDAAIEEALAEVEELSHRAEVHASSVIHDNPEFLNSPKWIEFDRWLKRNMELAPDEKTYLSAEEASAYYEKALRKEFDLQYLLYLLEGAKINENNDEDDYTLLKDDKFVEGNNFTISLSGGTVLSNKVMSDLEEVTFNPKDFEEFKDVEKPTLDVTSSYDADNKQIELTIQSDGTYSIYNKQIEVILTMIPPQYDYTTVTTAKRKELRRNDILENAMTATEDIIVTGGVVNTVGDVYAKGTFPEQSRVLSHQKGGVVVGYTQLSDDFLDPLVSDDDKSSIQQLINKIEGKGLLNVEGNVKSGTSVKLQNNDSELIVTTPTLAVEPGQNPEANYIAADSLIIMKNSENTKTSVSGDLILLDDLFISSSNTSIIVGEDAANDGTIITLFDGSGHINLVGPSTPDLSSSIRISGGLSDVSIKANKVFIPGVAYIDMFRTVDGGRKYYQTGESMTAENNFYFYQKQLSDQELRTKEFEYQNEAGDELNAYEYLKDKENEGDEDEIEESVKYKRDHFLTIVRDAIDDGDTEIIAAADKEIIDIRDTTTAEKFLAENYTLGVVLADGKVFNPSFMALSSPEFDDQYRYEFSYKADKAMSLLGIRKYIDDENIIKVNESSDLSYMDTFIDYSKNITIINESQLIVVNNIATDDIYINYPSDFTPPDNAIKYNDAYNLSGVVATKGNIFIYNGNTSKAFNFSGTLISDQSIILYGPGEKNITRSDENVYKTIAGIDELVTAFHAIDGKELKVLYTDGSTQPSDPDELHDGRTRNYTFDLDLDITDGGDSIDFNILTNPQLDGSSKEESVKGYIVKLWREY